MLTAVVLDSLWWGYVLATLSLTLAATISLHRQRAHPALDPLPLPSHFFCPRLSLMTGIGPLEMLSLRLRRYVVA